MKRIIRIGLLLLFLIAIIPSCELFDDCKTCQEITYDGSTIISEGTPKVYCGEDLAEKESMGPVQVGNYTAVWECY